MDNAKIINYIENSFLKDLINNQNVTDISYNGDSIFYQDNNKGRLKSSIEIAQKDVYDFIRQIANLSDSQFSYTDPILDISVDRYRINATHFAFTRKHREKAVNFSIRLGYNKLRIDEKGDFINPKCIELLEFFIKNNSSIIIGGLTSSGKTELQKFLISRFRPATRVIVIDNVDELDVDFLNPNIDLQTWLNLDKFKNINFDILVKNALRSNPDYLIISEARGEEMLSILNSAMSGHPTITTMHSKDIFSMYPRMTRMCMLKNQSLNFDETIIDIYEHFKLIVHVKKELDANNQIKRYIDSIATNTKGRIKVIYRYPDRFNKLPISLKSDLNIPANEFEKLQGMRTS